MAAELIVHRFYQPERHPHSASLTGRPKLPSPSNLKDRCTADLRKNFSNHPLDAEKFDMLSFDAVRSARALMYVVVTRKRFERAYLIKSMTSASTEGYLAYGGRLTGRGIPFASSANINRRLSCTD